MTKKIEVVAFDCDGIYVDSDSLQIEAEQQTALVFSETLGKELDIENTDWVRYQGWARKKIAMDLFDCDDVTADEFRKAVVDKTVEIASLENLKLIDEIEHFTDYLAMRGCRLGLATSSNRLIYEKYRELFDIGCFETTVAHGEAVDDKPKPGPYLELARRFNIEPAQMAVVEDSRSGIMAGRYAGSLVLGHATTQTADYLRRQTDAHIIGDSYRELAYQLQPYLP